MSVLATEIVDEVRTGWARPCPQCGEIVRYTVLNLGFSCCVQPFLYCDTCSDSVLREEDADALLQRFGQSPTLEEVKSFYEELERQLPRCPKGGRFTKRSNVKCPYCNYEFPNQLTGAARYFDVEIIWVVGAVVYRGSRAPSNRLVQVDVNE
jgi:hypothetical protein